VAGSYPERAGDAVFHTVALASPAGEIIARYRATHVGLDGVWAKAGDTLVVAPTTIGRVALVLGEELAVPEVFGVYSAERADIVAAPSGAWRGPVVEVDPKLFNTPPPPDTPFVPYAAAKLGQFLGGRGRVGPAREARRAAAWPRTGDRNTPTGSGSRRAARNRCDRALVGNMDQPGSTDRWAAAVEHIASRAVKRQRMSIGVAQSGWLETYMLVSRSY
jgi:hypothetical protein